MANDRLMILALRPRDAEDIVAKLAGMGPVATTATPGAIVAAARAGELGAAIITEDALAGLDLAELSAALADQPPWSDSGFVVLGRSEFGSSTRAALIRLLGNVAIIERRPQTETFVSAVRSMLRARARQRQMQRHMLDAEAAHAQDRDLAVTLKRRVEERSSALLRAMAKTAQMQRRLGDTEAIHHQTVQLTDHTPWVADATGKLLSVGPGWATPSGFSRDWATLVHCADLDALGAAWAASVDSGRPFSQDFRLRGRDDSFGWCRARAAAKLAADGSVERWYGTLEDIDKHRLAAAKLHQIETELIHVSRLSTMGTLASTLAHELNQPLTAITNYMRGSRRLLAGHPDYRRLSEALDLADRSAIRAGEIVRRVRELVTKGDVDRRPESLSTLLREACSVAMIDAHSTGIDFRLKVPDAQITVKVDRVQIQQVVLNLLRNAAEAVSAGPQRGVTLTATTTSDEFCEVVVSDTGPGLAAESVGRLFEPFNTTKSNGMGIGLSISRTIVEAHGGTIWHRPGPDGGAEFGFSLVRGAAEAAPCRIPELVPAGA